MLIATCCPASWLGGWPPTGFGARLRALREQAGLTQGVLAERAGCNPFTVAKLEGGRQEPAWPLVLALARALGVSCEAFNGAASGEPPQARPRGRPPKAKEVESPAPKGGRGRPRKGE
jgi:transcriptional regulator with XRE-family HTH domain